MTAPEPPEVEADELAAARPRCAYWCDYRDTSHEGPCLPNPTRRIADLEAGRDLEQQALRNAMAMIMGLQDDLARALPVVEAAGAYVTHHESLGWTVGQEVALLDALARAYRAAREPRTGEGT